MDTKLLEPELSRAIEGKNPLSFNATDPSFYTSVSFLWSLFYVVIIVAASYRYVLAGLYRMEASTSGIQKSDKEFKRVTWGLVLVLLLWVLIYTINPDMLKGDVGLGGLRVGSVAVTNKSSGDSLVTQEYLGSGGGSTSCSSKEDVISSLSSGNVCGNTTCSVFSGCNYKQYLPILKNVAGGDSQKLKMLVVIMCKESKANPKAIHQNADGNGYDCGLMQINVRNGKTCNDEPQLFDPETNIRKGAELLSQKMNVRSYGNIPTPASVFASYNCCSTGNPNDVSVSCTGESGFTNPIPKWACPINPGPTKTNMCFVKNYACELNACLSDPSLNSL